MALEITLRNWFETSEDYIVLLHSGNTLELIGTNDARMLEEVLDLLVEARLLKNASQELRTSPGAHRALIKLFVEHYDTLTDELKAMTGRLIRDILRQVSIESSTFAGNGSVTLSVTIGDEKVPLKRTFSYNQVGFKLV